MPEAEFNDLHDKERLKAYNEYIAKQEREELARFYNQPSANADFEHWSKAAHWTLDEAIALSFGKCPERVSWSKISPYSHNSPFVLRYSRIRDLAHRAAQWEKLFDPVLPVIFVRWAKENDIEFPDVLADKVRARGGNLVDWKSRYQELEILVKESEANWQSVSKEINEAIAGYRAEIETLKTELAQRRAASSAPAEKPQSTREREGMLKVIYGMAVAGYGYDQSKERSPVVPEIIKDLELHGLSLSDDTVRRYIKTACELLPEWKEANR